MDRASPFGILSLEELGGLSLDEKLAYLDLQLANLRDEAPRERPASSQGEADPQAEDPTLH